MLPAHSARSEQSRLLVSCGMRGVVVVSHLHPPEPCRLTLVVNSIMLAFGFVAMVVGGFGMNYNTWMAEESAGTSKVPSCWPHSSEQQLPDVGHVHGLCTLRGVRI